MESMKNMIPAVLCMAISCSMSMIPGCKVDDDMLNNNLTQKPVEKRIYQRPRPDVLVAPSWKSGMLKKMQLYVLRISIEIEARASNKISLKQKKRSLTRLGVIINELDRESAEILNTSEADNNTKNIFMSFIGIQKTCCQEALKLVTGENAKAERLLNKLEDLKGGILVMEMEESGVGHTRENTRKVPETQE